MIDQRYMQGIINELSAANHHLRRVKSLLNIKTYARAENVMIYSLDHDPTSFFCKICACIMDLSFGQLIVGSMILQMLNRI